MGKKNQTSIKVERNIRKYATKDGFKFQVKKSVNGIVFDDTFNTIEEAREFLQNVSDNEKVRNFDYPLTFIKSIFEEPRYNPYGSTKPPLYDIEYIENHFDENIGYVLETLRENEQEVLKLRFFDGFTLESTGKKLGLTRERIRQIEAKAIRKIRLPYRISILRYGKEILDLQDDISKLKEELLKIKIDIINKIKNPELREVSESEVGLEQKIEWLDLSVRAHHSLTRSGIKTVGQLVKLTPHEFYAIRNMGAKTRREINEKLKEKGFKPISVEGEPI